MKRRVILVVWLGVWLLSGCGTQSVNQTRNLSVSGLAYTEAVDKLLDTVVDRVIDHDNAVLIKTRRGSDPTKRIQQKNDDLLGLLNEVERFRSHTRLLQSYFLNLQALADSPIQNDTGASVRMLSDSLANWNSTLAGGGAGTGLTDGQKQQIGKLGGLVAGQIHAAKLRRALKRDAAIIGTSLALQENQLKNLTGMLKRRAEAEHAAQGGVITAEYANQAKKLSADWGNRRKQWIRARFVVQQLDAANEAARQLRGIWEDILQGKEDIQSLGNLISNVNEFVIVVQELETPDATK